MRILLLILLLILLVGLLHYIPRQSTYVLDKSVLTTGMKWNTDTLAPTEICSPEISNCRVLRTRSLRWTLSSPLSVSFCCYPHRSLTMHTSRNFELTPATIFRYNRKYKPEGWKRHIHNSIIYSTLPPWTPPLISSSVTKDREKNKTRPKPKEVDNTEPGSIQPCLCSHPPLQSVVICIFCT